MQQQYVIDNRTLKGIRRAKAKEDAADKGEEPSPAPPPEGEPQAAGGGDTLEDFLEDEGAAPPPVESDVSTGAEQRRADKREDGKPKGMYDDYDRKFAPTVVGKDKYGYPIDEFGNRVRKTNRPPYIMPEDWFLMSMSKRLEAMKEYDEQKEKWKKIEREAFKTNTGSSS